MKYLILRWLVSAVAVGLTAWLMPGMTVHGGGFNWFLNLFIVSAVLGFLNAVIRPIVTLLTCPLVILTLGLFTLIINAMMLSLTDWLLPNILTVGGFWTTLFAALIISIITGLLSIFVHDDSNY